MSNARILAFAITTQRNMIESELCKKNHLKEWDYKDICLSDQLSTMVFHKDTFDYQAENH